MKTLLFVHGTGVRERGFDETKRALQDELNRRSIGFADYKLEGCYWGKECGVKLPTPAKSVPHYDPGDLPTAREEELTKWLTLRCDPFFELREVVRDEGVWEPDFTNPKVKAPCSGIPAKIGGIRPEGDLAALLKRHRLAAYFETTVADLADSGTFQALCEHLKPNPGTLNPMFARMIVARTLTTAEADGILPVNGMVRDRLVELLIQPLGGRVGAIKDVFSGAMGMLWTLLGPGIRWATTATRSDLTNSGSPVAGDIVAYQGPHGPGMRKRIGDDIKNAPTSEVAVVAHSLGGIACVDLLIEEKLPKVTHLITVGSQAPFLYEIDALCQLRYGNPLPAHFPKNWMNVYDNHDILGYCAEDVFPNSKHVFVKDVEVDTGEPFPQAHGAYWTNDRFWDELKDFLRRP